jgi:hypothetical protein
MVALHRIVLVVVAATALGCRARSAPGGTSAQQVDDTRRHQEPAGGFSFVPPKDWQVRDFPGLKYKVVAGPPTAGFASNINILDGTGKGSLDDYVKANIVTLQKQRKNCRILSQEAFNTSAGLQGARVVAEGEDGDRLLRFNIYIFGQGDKKFVVTCTALADGGAQLDPVFEACLKTFRFENK